MLGPFRCSVVCGAAVSGSMMQCGAGKVAGEVKIQSDWSSNKVKPTLGQSGKVSLACDASPSDRDCFYGTLDTSQIYDWLVFIVSYD